MAIFFRIFGAAFVIALFGLLILYSNKLINILASSRVFLNKWYYTFFGRKVRDWQISFSRSAQLNKGTVTYKIYHFFDDLIINLDMKKDNVTVMGLLIFVFLISASFAIVLSYLMNSIGLFFPIVGAFFYLIIVILRFGGLMRYEKREAQIMDSVDLMVSDIRGGVYNAILKYLDSFHADIRPFFASFIDDVQNKGYSFKQAMGILNDKLGSNFTDFAQKAVIYEDKADETMEDIFSSIIETNRQRRTLREINNIKFAELRTQFIVSSLLIAGYALFSTLFDPFIFHFLTGNGFGKLLLIIDVLVIAFVLSYLASIKSKAL